MNLFRLAERQLARDKKDITMSSVLETAITIRKFMDKHPKITEHILDGGNYLKRGDGRLMIT